MIFLLNLALIGCQCSEEDQGGDEDTTNPTASVANTSTTSTTTVVGSAPTNLSAGVNLLTPEQYSKYVGDALSYRYGWDNPDGTFTDAITDVYAVALGGVDFQLTSDRDPDPKVQNLLVLRAINWDIALAVVSREICETCANYSADPILFTEVNNIFEDRPFVPAIDSARPAAWQDAIRAGETRWQAQVEAFYWRLFARPPTQAEIDLAKQHFSAGIIAEDHMGNGWVAYLYALLSTAEWFNP